MRCAVSAAPRKLDGSRQRVRRGLSRGSSSLIRACVRRPLPPRGSSTNGSLRGALRRFSAVAPRASAPASSALEFAPPPIAKLGGRGAWSGDELAKNPYWGRELSKAELEELDGALARAMRSGTLEFDLDDPSVPLNVDRAAFAS